MIVEKMLGALVGALTKDAYKWLKKKLHGSEWKDDRQLLEEIHAAVSEERRNSRTPEDARSFAQIELTAKALGHHLDHLSRVHATQPAATREHFTDGAVREVAEQVEEALPEGDLREEDLSEATLDLEPSDPVGDLTGETLSGYHLERMLGRGGFGSVYLGRNLVGKTAAIKVPHHPSQARRVLREARLIHALSHPAILGFENIVIEGATAPHLICELVNGRTLRQVLVEDGPLPPPVAHAITSQILAALAHAHARGVVHLDLKPENVMLLEDDDEPHVKILDFGIGRVSSQAQSSLSMSLSGADAAVIGTLDYMAPEQHDGEPDLDARADLYALGVTIFEMLTGRCPRGRARLPHDDPGLVELFEHCYVDDREERLADAREGLELLEHPAEGEPAASAPPPSAAEAAPTPPPRAAPPEPEPAPTPPAATELEATTRSRSAPREAPEPEPTDAGTRPRPLPTTESLPAADSRRFETPIAGASAPVEVPGCTFLHEIRLRSGHGEHRVAVYRHDGLATRLGLAAGESAVDVELCLVPRGRSTVGSPTDEPGRAHHEPKEHSFELSEDLLFLRTPLSARVWAADASEPLVPKVQVSWEEAEEFCEAHGLELPNSAAWEVACRAGATTPVYGRVLDPSVDHEPRERDEIDWYAGSLRLHDEYDAPELEEIAWYGGNSFTTDPRRGILAGDWPGRRSPHERAGLMPIAQRSPNGFGLFDMLGGVWEWTSDWFAAGGRSARRERIIRGGPWASPARCCRCAEVFHAKPTARDRTIGFRPVVGI